MSDEVRRVVSKLASLDVGFVAFHPGPSGDLKVVLSVDDVVAYADDPEAVVASKYGVSKDEYMGWHESSYAVICAGKTAKGKRCKMSVTGLTLIESPKVWAAHQGDYCSVHGGPAANGAH